MSFSRVEHCSKVRFTKNSSLQYQKEYEFDFSDKIIGFIVISSSDLQDHWFENVINNISYTSMSIPGS